LELNGEGKEVFTVDRDQEGLACEGNTNFEEGGEDGEEENK
jgi:hypothetical protein